VQGCRDQGYTAEQLAEFQQMDCTTAVATIEGTGNGGSSGTSGAGGSSSGGSKDCFGCQHDGTSCIYIGPAGGHSQCDPSCC